MNAAYQGLVALTVVLSVPTYSGAEKKIGKKMETPTIELPFQLKVEDLLKVDFACEYFPEQSKPWTESIRISGTTGVTLVRQNPGYVKPDTLHAKQDPQVLIALLKLFQDNGFFEKEVDVDPVSKDPIRYLALTIPGQSNRVAVGGRYTYVLGVLLGATRFAAGLSVPEALGRGYLSHL